MIHRTIFGSALVFFLAVFLITACGHRPSNAYNETSPVRFQPCSRTSSRGSLSLTQRSYAAMLRALREQKWHIEVTTESYEKIIGRACHGVENCAVVHFDVDPTGLISAYVPSHSPIQNNLVGHVTRWMGFLDQKYTNYRCMDDAMAMEELRLFSLAPRSSTASSRENAAPSQAAAQPTPENLPPPNPATPDTPQPNSSDTDSSGAVDTHQ